MTNWYSLSPLLLQKIIWVPTRIFLRFFVHFKIEGLENVSKVVGPNAIFACNHTSEMDPIFLPAAFPFFSKFSPMFYTSREERYYGDSGWRRHFYGGTLFKAWGAYPVFFGRRDYAQSLRLHIAIIKDGCSLCVYPEGRITRDGKLQEGRGGVAYMSYITGRPVIPVRLDGAFGINIKEFLLRRRTVSIRFGRPYYVPAIASEMSNPDYFKNYARRIMHKIEMMGEPQKLSESWERSSEFSGKNRLKFVPQHAWPAPRPMSQNQTVSM